MTCKTPTESNTRRLCYGLVTGCASTVLFNPADRALFLMVKENMSLFTPSIWKNPYQGVTNAVYGRVIGYGVYFAFSDIYTDFFREKSQISFFSSHPILFGSLATSMTTASLCQPVNILKMYQWNHHIPGGLLDSSKHMISNHGWRAMTKGLPHLYLRDGLFSCLYFSLSNRLNPEKEVGINILIASSSAALGSPINYARNRQFYHFGEGSVSLCSVINELRAELKSKPTLVSKVAHIAHDRFNVGWGTLRVGLGIAVADKIYHHLKNFSHH